jgi:hypothetical protein
MACGPSETRNDFVERLSEQILNVIGAGGEVPENIRCERLLNSLKAHNKYAGECRVLELLPQTWDSITAKLRRWDTDEMNAKKDVANYANTIICRTCGTYGHKSPLCPNRVEKNKAKKDGGGKKKHFNRNKKQGRINYKNNKNFGEKNRNFEKDRDSQHQSCHICREKGHSNWRCPYADEFAKILPELKRQKKDKNYNAANRDGNESDSSMMLTNIPEKT